MNQLGARARRAASDLACASTRLKNEALLSMANALESNVVMILEANARDLHAADEAGIVGSLRDRLRLDEGRIQSMAQGLREVAELADPVGEIVAQWTRPNGLDISQVRIPLGVIGMIYEARPNVTADAAGLCLKSGNVIFLRGGREAEHSNRAILDILRSAVEAAGLPADILMSFPTTDRVWISRMLEAEDYLDVIIPRGGESLIRFVTENSRVPVIKHYKGVCHIYVDGEADLDKARAICMNAKVQRPGVCNAMETLLVDEVIAARFLPEMLSELRQSGVELRGCQKTCKLDEQVLPATEEDYEAEFLDLILAIKVVNGIDGALDHIGQYASDHTESILSENPETVRRFIKSINSSVVIANASTRFSDGGQMGLGAEIGISTTKLHAYGPMGLVDLTTKKYVIQGTGQIRS
ncbi:MAG: glutamate-5-semialdehyde dehydrogenase [Bradymonadia bacterium]